MCIHTQAEFLISDILRRKGDLTSLTAAVRTIMSFLSNGQFFDFVADKNRYETTTIHFGGKSTEDDVRWALIAFYESLYAENFRDVDWVWNSHDSDNGVRVMTEDRDIPLKEFCLAASELYWGQ